MGTFFQPDDFFHDLDGISGLGKAARVGVGVSGGPDSMVLAWLLSQWAQAHGKEVLAVTVDHGLRPDSRQEAENVGAWIGAWPSVRHDILSWEGVKPGTRIMEEARVARYGLMARYFKSESVRFLFLGHHMDDQAETFLIRLTKGSGLDGLAGMKQVSPYSGDLFLVRPFLGLSKDSILAFCKARALPYVRDPSNENSVYLRPRLREARAVLEAEGLSNKRLAGTARRLLRARDALEDLADKAYVAVVSQEEGALFIDMQSLKTWPEEIGLRVLLNTMRHMSGGVGYGPRYEKVERLFDTFLAARETFRDTLGGCLFTYDSKRFILKIEKEHPGE